MFGNKSTKTVTFIVTAKEPAYSFVTDESDIFGEHTVTFDGQDPVSVGYGFKLVKPADPVKEDTATVRYEFIGWFNFDKEWNFEKDIVNYNINLQSKWNEIAIEVEKPDDTQSDSELDGELGSEQNSSNNDTAKPGASDLLAGCSGVIGGVASGLTALGVAAYVLLKKKEE
jgi:hypothetical protein